MIQVVTNCPNFEYDIRSLVKAFYPKQEITFADVSGVDKKLTLLFSEDKIGISFSEEGVPILSDVSELVSTERIDVKNVLKRLIYTSLRKLTGKDLKWGTLTGIRPTKLAMDLYEKGTTKQDVEEYMERTYLCSKEKIDLCMDIITKEHRILDEIDYKAGYSIYIGIPFCPSTCLYCSFASYSIEKFRDIVDAYLQALFKEIEYAKTACPHKKLTTVYVGGGTPTALSEQQLKLLLEKIREELDFTYVKEFTVEAGRPDSITREKLRLLKEYGVTRISINPQTMKQSTLDLIGRKHTVQQIIDTFNLARQEGHDNINMDIIIGLPRETVADVKHTLEEIKKLMPESLTVHTLAIKRAAHLNIDREKYQNMEAENVSGMLDLCYEFADKENYQPYYLYRQKNMAENLENIGYAKAGKEGIYNILIMEEKHTILALGAGSASKYVVSSAAKIERSENVKSVLDYINRIDEMIARKEEVLNRYADQLR